ncbi:MAG: hypothetical protein FWG50_13395 [Kiritimatiellaeota bacterium]|nr:hypothetical protein [Kiritimatiellota bacterium]
MTIVFGGDILCAGGRSDGAGSPSGPDGLNIRLAPGTEDYEYGGADGIDAEHVGCDALSVSFGVVRTYASTAAADAAAIVLTTGATRSGALAVDGTAVMARATLRDVSVRVSGCTLFVNYTIEGY